MGHIFAAVAVRAVEPATVAGSSESLLLPGPARQVPGGHLWRGQVGEVDVGCEQRRLRPATIGAPHLHATQPDAFGRGVFAPQVHLDVADLVALTKRLPRLLEADLSALDDQALEHGHEAHLGLLVHRPDHASGADFGVDDREAADRSGRTDGLVEPPQHRQQTPLEGDGARVGLDQQRNALSRVDGNAGQARHHPADPGDLAAARECARPVRVGGAIDIGHRPRPGRVVVLPPRAQVVPGAAMGPPKRVVDCEQAELCERLVQRCRRIWGDAQHPKPGTRRSGQAIEAPAFGYQRSHAHGQHLGSEYGRLVAHDLERAQVSASGFAGIAAPTVVGGSRLQAFTPAGVVFGGEVPEFVPAAHFVAQVIHIDRLCLGDPLASAQSCLGERFGGAQLGGGSGKQRQARATIEQLDVHTRMLVVTTSGTIQPCVRPDALEPSVADIALLAKVLDERSARRIHAHIGIQAAQQASGIDNSLGDASIRRHPPIEQTLPSRPGSLVHVALVANEG